MPRLDAAELKAAIVEHLGDTSAAYAERKTIGGNAGKKGGRYEDLFTTAKVAEEAAALVDDPSPQWPYVQGQFPCFVDDLVVSGQLSTRYFQCKNSANVSWTSGDHPICEDFRSQMVIAEALRHPQPSTCLVVSDTACSSNLARTVPDTISGHTRVHYFPYSGGRINRLVIENPGIQDTMRTLTKVTNPEIDEMVGAFTALNAACAELSTEGADVGEILEYVRRYLPAQLRMFPAALDWNSVLDPQFRQALAMIQGLVYDATRGYFHWRAFGMSGVFSFDCNDYRFTDFQSAVIRRQPTTFEELESLLP